MFNHEAGPIAIGPQRGGHEFTTLPEIRFLWICCKRQKDRQSADSYLASPICKGSVDLWEAIEYP